VAIPEVCQVWIEQRLEEELEESDDTKKSLRAVGREIAAEIERLFQVKLNPRTLEKRAERMVATNVAPSTTPEETTENERNQVFQDGLEQSHGGKREGAGRKPKSVSQQALDSMFPPALELLAVLKFVLRYLYKAQADGMETAVPVTEAIRRAEDAISKAEQEINKNLDMARQRRKIEDVDKQPA